MKLSEVQVSKASAELCKRIKAANKAFRAANPSYTDITVDSDDKRILAALDDDEAAAARLRIDYVMASRSTATIDLLGVKTERDTAEEGKYKMVPYLGAKRYRRDGSVWKQGYQDPDDTEEPVNRFIGADGTTFQVLRSVGLFQLLTDAEVDDFVKKLPIDFELYFSLFF